MPPTRIVLDRCAVCDGALRAAARSVVRGVPLVQCAACGHRQVEREPDPVADDHLDDATGPYPSRWNAFEKAARRLLALRSMGIEGGPLLDVGDGTAFTHVASAGPFEVTSVSSRGNGGASRGLLEALREKELPLSSFRVATVWSGLALEPDPVGLLEHLRGALAPGGLLALAVHVEDYPAAMRRLPRGRDPLTAARHVFSRTSLRAAVLRSGFDVTSLVPADLQSKTEGLRFHEQLAARASLSVLGTLARERRYATRFIPEVLWRMADTAELWATRSPQPR
jgi:SAM-dependent methyltransferase